MFASMLGVFLAIGISVVVFLIVIFAMISSASKEKDVAIQKNSVLHIKLDEPISERTSNNPVLRHLSISNEMGLNDILANIRKAKTDDNIRGIYLELSEIPSGFATIEEIRSALIDFKLTKKFVIAFGEVYSQGAYYLASIADKIYLYPEGAIDFKGLKAEVLFFKGALDKLEIEPQIIRHGKFKSAVEPFLLDKMSPENREQVKTFVGSVWSYLKENISKSRNISVNDLQIIVDSLKIQEAQDAFKYHLVDKLAYKDEMLSDLKKSLGLKESDKVNFVGLKKYDNVVEKKMEQKFIKEKIAIIYAAGDIVSGEGKEKNIGSDKVSEALKKARLDVNVKAVVLRINSPGGSALASDVIWREVVLTNKVKPVVVSMGDYAASGGYYIACAASKIIAEPTTITGSIGVFGLMFNAQKLLNEKLGITIDTFKTGKFADMGSSFRPLTPAEKNILQRSVEKIYEQFVTKVANGRHLTKWEVDSIGQGRVWSAIDAKKIGLVDEFGGINTAIAEAAKLSKTDKYRILTLPEQKDPFMQFLEGISGEAQTYFYKQELQENFRFYNQLHEILENNGIQTRLPYQIQLY